MFNQGSYYSLQSLQYPNFENCSLQPFQSPFFSCMKAKVLTFCDTVMRGIFVALTFLTFELPLGRESETCCLYNKTACLS